MEVEPRTSAKRAVDGGAADGVAPVTRGGLFLTYAYGNAVSHRDREQAAPTDIYRSAGRGVLEVLIELQIRPPSA